jgi:hypothetical protein
VNSDIPEPRKPLLKNPLFYTSLLLLFGAIYVGIVILIRYESKREFERHAAQERSEQRRQDDLRAIEQLGGSDLSIRSLYVSPTIVTPGESAQLCYDVANAKTVTLDPPVAEVWPSHSRCVDLRVKKSTNYTLTIGDGSGKTTSQSVELIVK